MDDRMDLDRDEPVIVANKEADHGAGALAGTKRKEADTTQMPASPRRIQALAIDVVNRIAAGEIIVGPVNALKELVENSVDAGSTSIEVLVKDGGLKLLQITDNGCGIRKEDLAILCQRHTTSKLADFKDLDSITSYGFRGEALASISHVAHLAVTTKTATSDTAYRAHYLDGNLCPARPGQSEEPKKIAGRVGTQITVEDMFFNIPIRRRACRSPNDEFNKIIDMLGRYAIHCERVGFSCKKQGEASTSLAVPPTATVVDRIRQIYGTTVAKELVRIETSSTRWGFKVDGWITNANYHIKRPTLLLFINHRSVESAAVKKAVEKLYVGLLPRGGHPFVYLSLEVRPDHVDVNVHPTKRMVGLVNEDEIIEDLCECIRLRLTAVDTSRTFATQTLLSGRAAAAAPAFPSTASSQGQGQAGRDGAGPPLSGPDPKRQRRNSNSLVRTDAMARKITTMFTPLLSATPNPAGSAESSARDGEAAAAAAVAGGVGIGAPEKIVYEIHSQSQFSCQLDSILKLRADVREEMHADLTKSFSSLTFVGIVDEHRRLAAIQTGVTLFLIDYGHACFDYFYQVGLTDFANFGRIQFRPALSIRQLVGTAADQQLSALPAQDRYDRDERVDSVVARLLERRRQLSEYFGMEVTAAGELVTLPILVKGYTPPLVKLPQFLLGLGPRVDWDDEEACFDNFLRELAAFYVPERLPETPGDEAGLRAEQISEELRARRNSVRWAVEHLFFPAFKARLVATKTFAANGVWEMANVKGLYRVFERC